MQENIIKGFIGALIGSIIGGLVVLLVARMGFISKISTVIFGVAIVFGYKKLANGFSIIGAIICTVISAVVTYFIFTLDTTMTLYPLLEGTYLEDISFWECFSRVKEIMTEADSISTYNHNLFLMELMGVVGTIAGSYGLLKEE